MTPEEHKAKYHHHMDEYEGWNEEGNYLDSAGKYPDQAYAKADYHLQLARDHASAHYNLTGSPIKERSKRFRKMHNPQHVSEALVSEAVISHKEITESKTTYAKEAAKHRDKVEEYRNTPVSRFVNQFGNKAGRVRERYISYHSKMAHHYEKLAMESTKPKSTLLRVVQESVLSGGRIQKTYKKSPWISSSSKKHTKEYMVKTHGLGQLRSVGSGFIYKDVYGRNHHYEHDDVGGRIRYKGSYFRP